MTIFALNSMDLGVIWDTFQIVSNEYEVKKPSERNLKCYLTFPLVVTANGYLHVH